MRPALARFRRVRPARVASCASAEDVATALAKARAAGLPLAVRSGGHCFGGRSSTEGLVIDVSPLDAIEVGDGVVRVGAGGAVGGSQGFGSVRSIARSSVAARLKAGISSHSEG